MVYSVKERVLSFFELMRPGNCLMAALAVLVAAIISSKWYMLTSQELYTMILAMFSAFVICGGGQAINDYFDAKIDAKISKEKPIPSKRVKKIEALAFALALYIIGITIASIINQAAFSIALWIAVLMTLYSGVMTKVKYLGNFVVAFGTAMTFIFGAAAMNNITPAVMIFAGTAFFANVAREITKDFEDIKKDKGTKQTLPILFGKKAIPIVTFFYICAPAIAILAFFYIRLNNLYLAGIILTTIAFGYAFNDLMNKKYSNAQKKCKAAMVFSLIAFILSAM